MLSRALLGTRWTVVSPRIRTFLNNGFATVRNYAKIKHEIDVETGETFQQARKRALLRKNAETLRKQLENDTIDPLIRRAQQEIEDEDLLRQGRPAKHGTMMLLPNGRIVPTSAKPQFANKKKPKPQVAKKKE